MTQNITSTASYNEVRSILRYIEREQGPKTIQHGQHPVGVVKAFLEADVETTFSGRIWAMRMFPKVLIFQVGDVTGYMFVRLKPDFYFMDIIDIGDYITVTGTRKNSTIIATDAKIVGKGLERFNLRKYANENRTYIQQMYTQKIVRAFFGQHGFMEITGPVSPDWKWDAIAHDIPRAFAFLNGAVEYYCSHSDTEGMRRILQLMLNTLQYQLDKRVLEPEIPVRSYPEVKTSLDVIDLTALTPHEPFTVLESSCFFLNGIPAAWRMKSSAIMQVDCEVKGGLADKVHLYYNRMRIACVQQNQTNILEFLDYNISMDAFSKPARAMKRGIPPFASGKLSLNWLLEILNKKT